MTNANHLISPDNKGYASYHWEHDVSRKSGFVAAFAQTNAGNLSPNLNLKPGSGPFDNEFDNTREIGRANSPRPRDRRPGSEEVLGELDSRFRFVDFTRLPIRPEFTDGQPRQLCTAAIGTSLAAGSTKTVQRWGWMKATIRSLGPWRLLTSVPPQELVQCQAEKTILADTGNKKPYPWTPTVLPIQMFRIGQLELLGAPAEFTVMAGADPPRGRRPAKRPVSAMWSSMATRMPMPATSPPARNTPPRNTKAARPSTAPGPRPPTSSCSSTWRWRCANACRWKPRR